MLKWTVGEAALLHCINFAKIDHVLTSKSFYENVKNPGTEKIVNKYIYMYFKSLKLEQGFQRPMTSRTATK